MLPIREMLQAHTNAITCIPRKQQILSDCLFGQQVGQPKEGACCPLPPGIFKCYYS